MSTMVSSELFELIAAGESQTVEFKATFDKAGIESLVAFANALGGTVLVGVFDAGLVTGVTVGKETLNEWLGQIKSSTSPSIIPDLVAQKVDGISVVVIKVGEFPVKPVSIRGRYFKRVASSNLQLKAGEIADLYMQSVQLSWDANAHSAGVLVIACIFIPLFALHYGGANPAAWAALVAAAVLIVWQIKLLIHEYQSVDAHFQFLERLHRARHYPEIDLDSYRYLREHGNAFFIMVLEIIFIAVALSALNVLGTQPYLPVWLIFWAMLGALVYFFGHRIEAKMVASRRSGGIG